MDGKTLRIARTMADMTMNELAKKVGLHLSTVARYETGVNRMNTQTNEKIKEVLNGLGIGQKELLDIANIVQNQEAKQAGICPYCQK